MKSKTKQRAKKLDAKIEKSSSNTWSQCTWMCTVYMLRIEMTYNAERTTPYKYRYVCCWILNINWFLFFFLSPKIDKQWQMATILRKMQTFNLLCQVRWTRRSFFPPKYSSLTLRPIFFLSNVQYPLTIHGWPIITFFWLYNVRKKSIAKNYQCKAARGIERERDMLLFILNSWHSQRNSDIYFSLHFNHFYGPRLLFFINITHLYAWYPIEVHSSCPLSTVFFFFCSFRWR